jgi:hypothetical protein
VTCQHIVGLRSRALLGSRQLNASRPNTRDRSGGSCLLRAVPCRAEPHRALLHSGRDDVTRQHARFQGNADKHSDRATGNRQQCRSFDCGFIRGTEMSTQSVFRKQLYERILRSSPTSEVSIGDRHGKCEDAKCVII